MDFTSFVAVLRGPQIDSEERFELDAVGGDHHCGPVRIWPIGSSDPASHHFLITFAGTAYSSSACTLGRRDRPGGRAPQCCPHSARTVRGAQIIREVGGCVTPRLESG